MLSSSSTFSQSSSPCYLELLSDEILGKIASYLDFASTKTLAQQETSTVISRTLLLQQQCRHVWIDLQKRLGFSNDKIHDENRIQELSKRLEYSRALMPAAVSASSLGSLPHRAWYFLPVRTNSHSWHSIEDEYEEEDNDDEAHVNEWQCEDAFALLGGSSASMICLDPFTDALVWKTCILSQAISAAAEEEENDLLVFHKTTAGKQQDFDTTQLVDNKEELLLLPSPEDSLNLSNYVSQDEYPNIQVEVTSLGVQVSPVLDDDCFQVISSAVSLARSIESTNVPPNNNALRIVEVWTWYLNEHDSSSSSRPFYSPPCVVVTRFNNVEFWIMDVCARKHIVFTNEYSSNHAGSNTVQIHALGTTTTTEGEESTSTTHHWSDTTTTSLVAQLRIQEPVRFLVSCPTGNQLLVLTTRDKLQIWNTESVKQPWLQETIDIPETLAKTINMASRRREPQRSTSVPQQRVFAANHLPFQVGGFVTLQFSEETAYTLLVWKYSRKAQFGEKQEEEDDDQSLFEIVSMIDLPISVSRKPRIHFDGRRLIVVAKDQIGYLLLVYQVRLSGDDDSIFQQLARTPSGVQTHGNVYNFGSIPQVRFANRIRHASLGGLEDWESLQMTCNDRFIVINTRQQSGEFATAHNQGLVVIDLEAALDK